MILKRFMFMERERSQKMNNCPVCVELLDQYHRVVYVNAFSSIKRAKACIKELDTEYKYIRVTFESRCKKCIKN